MSDHGFEPNRSGKPGLTDTHDSDAALHGVYFARGPGIPSGERFDGLSVNDVTPTVLAWLGMARARDMDGHAGPFLEGSRPEEVDTYDDIPIERASHISAVPGELDEALLARLRTLGYVE